MKKIFAVVLAVCVVGLVFGTDVHGQARTGTEKEKTKATSPLPPSKGEKEKPAPTSLDVAVGHIVEIVGNTADEMRTTAKERAAIVWTLQAVSQAAAAYQQYK